MDDRAAKRDGFGIGEAGQAPATTTLDELEAERLQPTVTPSTRMVKCDCGHTVPAALVMCASLGRVCPNCYDDWSD
jgi:hypothetical protein